MYKNLQIVESDQHQKVKMTVAKVENIKVNIKVKNTLVKFMKVQKCLQGICPLRGADTRRSLALRATYGGWKTFYGRPTLLTLPASIPCQGMSAATNLPCGTLKINKP